MSAVDKFFGSIASLGPNAKKAIEGTTNAFKSGGKYLSTGSRLLNGLKASFSGLWGIVKAHPILTAVTAIGALNSVLEKYYDSREQSNITEIEEGNNAADKAKELYDAYSEYQKALGVANTATDLASGVESSLDSLTSKLGIQKDAVDELSQSYKDLVTEQLKADRIELVRGRNGAAENLANVYGAFSFTAGINRKRLNEFDPIQNEYLNAIYEGSTIDRAEATVEFYKKVNEERDKIIKELEAEGKGRTSTSMSRSYDYIISQLKPHVETYLAVQGRLDELDTLIRNVNQDKVTQAQQSRSYVQTVRDSQAAQIAGLKKQALAYSKYIDAIARYKAAEEESAKGPSESDVRKFYEVRNRAYNLAEQEGFRPKDSDIFAGNLETYKDNVEKINESLAYDESNRNVASSLRIQRDSLSEYVRLIDDYNAASEEWLNYEQSSGEEYDRLAGRYKDSFDAMLSAAVKNGFTFETVKQFIEYRDTYANAAQEMSDQIAEIESGLLSDESITSLQKRRDVYSSYVEAITEYNKMLDTGLTSKENEALQNLIKVAEEAGYSEESLGDFLANFDTYAENISLVTTEIERMQQGLKLLDAYLAGSHALNVWDSLKTLWDSESFADTKTELKELAKTVDGITPDKILELAQNNKELASVLNTAGMTAQFLANILQNEALQDGSGFEMITESALMLNYALNSAASAFAAVAAAKSQYDAAMSAGEVDDNFKSFAQAYETLQGEIDAGKQGNAFWASAEYVFGTKQLEEWGYSVEKVASAMENAQGILGDAESGGFGFLDKLYSLAEGGKITADDGSVLAEIAKLSDGSYDFKVNMDQLDSLAEKVGVSKEAILASMEALSLWGDVSYYDIENVMGVMKEIGLASDNFNGTAVNVSNLTEQLMQLGYKGKALYDIKEAISSLDGVTLIDINGDIGELADNLVSLGVASQDGSGIKINADSFAQMAQSLQFSKEQATSLYNQLKSLENVSFVDNAGAPVDEIAFDEQTISMVVDVDDAAVQAFMSQNHDKTATLTYNVVKNGDVGVGATGSVGVNAHARGTDSAPGGPSMVGEEGEEIVQSGDKAYFVGTNGPEIVNLNKGDTVYPADETKKIKNGRHTLSGHIPSFKSGTSTISNIFSSIGTAISGLIGKIGGTVKKPDNNPKKSSGGGGGGGSSDSAAQDEKLEKVDWIERAIKKIEREIDKLKKIATSTFKSLGSKMTAASNEISKITDEIELQGKAAERYRQEAESVELDEGLKQKVRDGTIDIQEYNEETRKLIEEYKKWIDKSYECEDALTDLHETLASVYEENFNAIKSDFDNQLGFIEHDAKAIEHNISMLEAKGYMSSTKYYEQMQQNNRKTLDTLNAERTALEQSLAEAIASGKIEEGSEAWYSMKNAINETQEKIDDTNLSLQETANSIRQIQWDYFDYGYQKINALSDEAEFLINLMSDSELFDKQGKVTDTGLATMGLHGERYNVFMANADRYAEEIKKLDGEIANDPYNTTLLERRQELIEAQRESIIAANDEKTAIRDLVKQGIDLELQSMQDLIDKYNESLETAKDLYDYQKKVKSQADDIKNIQKQLSAYKNDLSEETRAKVQKLTVSLEDAQDKLEETEYQQYIADQKKLLDDLYSDYEQVLNERLDDLDALVTDVITQVNRSGADICETLGTEAAKVGYSIGTATQNIWNGSSITLDGVLTTYGNDFSSKLTGVNASLSNILNAVVAMAEHSDAIAEGSIPRYKKGELANFTGLAYMDGTSTDPEVVLDATDSANLIALRDLMRRNPDFSSYTGGGMPTIDAGSDIMRLMGVLSQMSESGTTFGDTNIYVDIDHVENYNDFVNKLRDDKNFEKMVRAMTTNRLKKDSSAMEKTKYRW